MLDWFSGYVGYDASGLQFGRFFEVEPGGEVVRERSRWETARGSYESGVQITQGLPTPAMLASAEEYGFLCSPRAVLRLSGNPSKFLQGHNAAGPSVSKLGPVLQALARSLGEGFRPTDADQVALPSVHRSRVDVTTACDLGSHQLVHDWLRLAATNTRSRHGRARDASGTVYWGKTSTRWSLKAYCKHCELLAHPPIDNTLLAELLEWTRPHLRIELTLRRPELKDRGTLDESIIWEFFKKIEVSEMVMKSEAPEGLRSPVKAAFQLWLDGKDLACFFPRRTLYKYRREILDQTGVDVLLPMVQQPDSAGPTLLSVEELRSREVKNAPDRVQRSLFGAGI